MNVKQRPRPRHNLDLVNSKFCIAVELWPLVRQLREALKVKKIKGWKFPTKGLTCLSRIGSFLYGKRHF